MYIILVCRLQKELYNVHSVVTGCTDGIGKAIVLELANRGFKKFILIGRNQRKLDDVAEILGTR